MPIPPLAHLGHWYVSLPVFMGPVLTIAIALKIQTWRERVKGPNTSGKRSALLTTSEDRKTTIAVVGPLDYPALVEIESALGTLQTDVQTIVLDLREINKADQEAAWSLCDAIGRSRDPSNVTVVLGTSGPEAGTLEQTLANEGIAISRATAPSEPGAAVATQTPQDP